MEFKCRTDRRLNWVKVTDTAIGSPLTAASWFLERLPKEEQQRVGLVVYVVWNNNGDAQQYELGESGRLQARG